MKKIDLPNGISIELSQQGGVFKGLAAVSCGGVKLRSGRLPMFVEIRSPDAVKLVDWRLARTQKRNGGWRLGLTPAAQEDGIMEWMLHTVRNRYRVTDWSESPKAMPDTNLELLLKPVERKFGNWRGRGFSYQYRYSSKSVPIFKILDRGSWELGGKAVGNQFWMRNSFGPCLYEAKSVKEHYTTEWWLPGIHNPDIFQFAPWQTAMQGFTFTAHREGVLVTWATRVRHIRSLFEKRRGMNELLHLHEHCDDLGNSLETSPVEVLFFPGRFDRVEAINLYEKVRNYVWNTLHSEIGFRREWHQPYGVIEEWGMHDFKRSTRAGVPALARFGIKWIMIPSQFEHNMNVWGLSNMCCTVDYKIAKSVGEAALRKFVKAAAARRMKVDMWGNTALSTLTWIFNNRQADGRQGRIRFLPKKGSVMEAYRKAEQPWIRNPSGAIEADHYTPVFALTNLRDPAVRKYWHKCWKALHDRVAVKGIFLDSSFNLSSDKFHWMGFVSGKGGATADQAHLLGRVRPANEAPRAILSQYRAHLDLMREMQDYGYRYSPEDVGLFGVCRTGGPSIASRIPCLWQFSETMCTFDEAEIRKTGADPDEVFFQGLAFRMMWYVFWQCDSGRVAFCQLGNPKARLNVWHASLFKAFNEADADMRSEREVLAGESGVLYRNGRKRVLWAFRDIEHPLRRMLSVKDLTEQRTIKPVRILSARKLHVYAWE